MPSAVIVVVVDDVELLTDLRVICGDVSGPTMTSPREPRAGRSTTSRYWLTRAGTSRVVLAATELPNVGMTGVELLTSVRARHPQARRLLLVERGQWRGHPVREAMVLGQVDSYVFVP
jgi:hypothetical protein